MIIYKEDLAKAFSIYLNNLEEFLFRPATPQTMHHIQAKIHEISRRYYQNERSDVWRVPVLITPDGRGSFLLHPNLDGVTLRSRLGNDD